MGYVECGYCFSEQSVSAVNKRIPKRKQKNDNSNSKQYVSRLLFLNSSTGDFTSWPEPTNKMGFDLHSSSWQKKQQQQQKTV